MGKPSKGEKMPRLLFLAQFAPTNGKMITPATPEEEFYAKTYHLPIWEILKKNKYDFVSSNDVGELINNHHQYDLVWSVYNRLGFRNSEIFIQSLCEYFGIPYIGAAPNVRAMVEDKSQSKLLAEHLSIPTAAWIVASSQYPLSGIPDFTGPYFVKPRFGSASLGIDETCLCKNWSQVLKKAAQYFNDGTEVIVEKYIDGTYYGVPVLNGIDGIPLIAVPHYQTSSKKGNIITNSQKRFTEGGMNRFISNDQTINKILTHYTEQYFLGMQPCDYARIDYIVEKATGIPYFLEVNTLMNLGQQGGFIASFLESGFNSYESIIQYIIDLGISRISK